jgi:exonuclease III
VRLLCWNVNKRVRERLRLQLEAVERLAPDVVGLQEITPTNSDGWLEGLAALGLEHAVSSLDVVPAARAQRRPARSGVLLASRWPLLTMDPWDGVAPFPERQLSGIVAAPGGPVEVHVVHIPSSGRMRELGIPLAKAETYEAIYARLARVSEAPMILCGDLNAPLDELPDGTVLPWGPDKRTAAGELLLLVELVERHGFVDAFRVLHGYADRAPSWHGLKRGYRLDHVLASAALRPTACRYLDDLRTGRLSDHAPVEAVFEWRAESGE